MQVDYKQHICTKFCKMADIITSENCIVWLTIVNKFIAKILVFYTLQVAFLSDNSIAKVFFSTLQVVIF